MIRILAIVQVRMSSTRLFDKALKRILGKPILWHIVNRLERANLVDDILIATSHNVKDKPIIQFAKENGISYYAGSELDLVDRLYQAAKIHLADAIVRITGDCPLVDPVLVDKVIGKYLDNQYDYVDDFHPRSYPDGLDVSIFSFTSLEKVWNEVKEPFQREWVTTNFYDHPEKFRLGYVVNELDLSYMRWTVDYQDDLEFVTEIYKRLYQEDRIFLMEDILKLLREHPELEKINQGHVLNEAYYKALAEKDKGVKS